MSISADNIHLATEGIAAHEFTGPKAPKPGPTLPIAEITVLIDSVSPTKDGVTIKLADRMKALRWLASYFELNPSDRHRAAYQSKMAELREREIKNKEDGW